MRRYTPECPRLIAPCASIVMETEEADPKALKQLLSPEWDKAHFEMAKPYSTSMLLFIAFGGGY